MADSIDEIVQTELRAGTNVIYASNASGTRATATTTTTAASSTSASASSAWGYTVSSHLYLCQFIYTPGNANI